MTADEQLARAERDCVDLHKALATAIRRLRNIDSMAGTGDLMDVLDRTSRPTTEPERNTG